MVSKALFLSGILALTLASGCANEEPKSETPVGGSTAQTPTGKMPDDDIHRGLKPPSETAPSAGLAALKKAQSGAKAAFEKNPNDSKAKSAYVAATVKLGTATMNADELPPREKYRGALALYREALKLDPKNEEALENKKLIEDIYKGMGRPVPQ